MAPNNISLTINNATEQQCILPAGIEYRNGYSMDRDDNRCLNRLDDVFWHVHQLGENLSSACIQYLFADGVFNATAKYRAISPLLNEGYTAAEDVEFTRRGCEMICSPTQRFYEDAGVRVVIWVVPTVFLLSNIQLPALGWKAKLFSITSPLGNPIDCIWSLLDKLYEWNTCVREATNIVDNLPEQSENVEDENVHDENIQDEDIQDLGKQCQVELFEEIPEARKSGNLSRKDRIRILAEIFAAMEEKAGPQIKSQKQVYESIAKDLGVIAPADKYPKAFEKLADAARKIVDRRTNEFVRTGIAIALYIFSTQTAFFDTITGNAGTSPGGRVGSALLLSWLITITLLGNLIGSFANRRVATEILNEMVIETTKNQYRNGNAMWDPAMAEPQGDRARWGIEFDRMQATGAIYSYRTWKIRKLIESEGKEKAIRVAIMLASALPVVLAFIIAFVIHWKSDPEGYGCRHIWILGIFVLWILSAVSTSVLHFWMDPMRLWYFSWLKDSIIGLAVILLVFFSVAGAFNSCLCWTLTRLFFPLEKNALFHYKEGLFPGLVALTVGLNLGFVSIVLLLMKRALIVSRAGEELKRREFEEREGPWEEQPLNRFLCHHLQST